MAVQHEISSCAHSAHAYCCQMRIVFQCDEFSVTPAPIESEIEDGMAAIAGIPPAVQRTPRP